MRTLRQQLHHNIVGWLKPGGKVILEAFHPNQLYYNSGGPKDRSMLYTAKMLQSDFNSLTIQQLEEIEIQLNEGPYHCGAGFVTRMVAQKQAAIKVNIKSKKSIYKGHQPFLKCKINGTADLTPVS